MTAKKRKEQQRVPCRQCCCSIPKHAAASSPSGVCASAPQRKLVNILVYSRHSLQGFKSAHAILQWYHAALATRLVLVAAIRRRGSAPLLQLLFLVVLVFLGLWLLHAITASVTSRLLCHTCAQRACSPQTLSPGQHHYKVTWRVEVKPCSCSRLQQVGTNDGVQIRGTQSCTTVASHRNTNT